jgi:hypothetical protein
VLGTVLKQFSGKQSSPFMELFGQLCLTVCATVSYCLGNCVLLLVQLCLTTLQLCLTTLQLCLTTCGTVSYYLWKCLTNSPPIYRTVLGTVLEQLLRKTVLTAYGNGWQSSSPLWNCLCNRVLLLVQPCLTACATVSYCLCKWLARSFPIYGNGFRSCTSENQRLHKELSNSKNRVTYRLR